MSDPLDAPLLDEALDAYVDWHEACLAVWDAYGRWTRARTAGAGLAFAAYRGALEAEERASAVYAGRVSRVGDPVTADTRRVKEPIASAWRARR